MIVQRLSGRDISDMVTPRKAISKYNENISRCVLRERVTSELFTLKLTREQETEADLTGMQLFQRTEIDPSATIRFFERLSEKDEG